MNLFKKKQQPLSQQEKDQILLDIDQAVLGDEQELKDFQQFVNHLQIYKKYEKLLNSTKDNSITQDFELINGNLKVEMITLTIDKKDNITLEKKIPL